MVTGMRDLRTELKPDERREIILVFADGEWQMAHLRKDKNKIPEHVRLGAHVFVRDHAAPRLYRQVDCPDVLWWDAQSKNIDD